MTVRYAHDDDDEPGGDARRDRIQRSDALKAIRALARSIDAKDRHTRKHSERVAELAARLAAELGWSLQEAARLHEAGLVHDVGKIGVSDAALLKPGRLTAEEYRQVKEHAALGARIVTEVLAEDQVSWVAHHHERWDGRGYPDGLTGPEIPEGARILALADAWDAMTVARVYGEARDPADALAECRRCSGSHFWPDAVTALARVVGMASGGEAGEAKGAEAAAGRAG